MLKSIIIAAVAATSLHALPAAAAGVSVVDGLELGFVSQAEARFRNLSGARNDDQIYVGHDNLASSAVRDQAKLDWSTASSWAFKFNYDAITGVTSMNVGSASTSFDIGDNGAAVNALFLELRDGSEAPQKTGTMSIDNVMINGMAVTNPSIFAVDDATKSWTLLFDASTSFSMMADFNIDGTWKGSREGSKVTFKAGSVPAPIPLPAAGWMLISGLAGIGAIARRRRRAA